MKRKGSPSNYLAIVVIVAVLVEGWLSGGISAVTVAAAPVYAVAPAEGSEPATSSTAGAARARWTAPLTPSVPAQEANCTVNDADPISQGFGAWANHRELSPNLPGTQTGSGFKFLVGWSQPYLNRLDDWLEAGVRFEGRWSSDELCVIVDALETMGARLGYARFLNLVHLAVGTRSGGTRDHLTIRRLEQRTKPTAGWMPGAGSIIIKTTFFDRQYMYGHHRWNFLDPADQYSRGQREILIQKITVAHELGHVLIDGLHTEVVAAGYDELTLESVYTGTVPIVHWPHPGYHPNENLATEVALWALGMDRPADVVAFRSSYLAPTMTSATWPQALTAGLAPAPRLASR